MRLRAGLRFDAAAGEEAAAGAARAPARIRARPPVEGGLARVVERAAASEAAGVEIVWLSERPDRAGAALPLCAAVAARTTRLRVGAGPLALPLFHPLRLAEDAASLDGLAGGRLELGLGLGRHPESFGAFGIDRGQRAGRFEEGVALLRRAWADAAVEFAGCYFSVSAIEVVPKPAQRPAPPIWVGAGADAAVCRAARLGAGLLAGSAAAPAVYLEAWRAAGRDPAAARLALELPLVLADEPASLARALPGLARPAGALAPAVAAAVAIVCRVEEAADALVPLLEPLREVGTIDLIAPGAWPGLPDAAAARSAELLARGLRDALARRLGRAGRTAATSRRENPYNR